MLIAINVLVFALMYFSGGGFFIPLSSDMIKWGANFNALTTDGECWRLVTCMFIHGGAIHLFVNMLALKSVGTFVEINYGWFVFICFYFLCGIAASVCSIVFNVFVLSVGASGAIFGMFGIYISVVLINYIKGHLEISILLQALLFLSINFIIGFSVSFIDNAAHLGGLVCGLLIGFAYFFAPLLHRAKMLLISLSIALVLLSALFFYPSYTTNYYKVFSGFFSNEREANRILFNTEHGLDNTILLAQLKQASALWQNNLQMVETMQYSGINLQHDLDVLKQYALYKQKIITLYSQSVEQECYLYLDSIEFVNSDIAGLPELEYKLDFFADTISQNEPGKKSLTEILIYYNSEWEIIKNKNGASFFRVGAVDSLGMFTDRIYDFHIDSIKQMKGQYSKGMKDGVFFYFHRNGYYETAGMYNNDVPVGKWQHFYANKQLKMEERYDMGNHTVENFWDESGLQTIKNGNGIFYEKHDAITFKETGYYKNGLKDSIWKGFLPDGELTYTEWYKAGQLIKGEKINATKIINYTNLYIGPQPIMGDDAYQAYLAENLKYPPAAIKNKIAGKVLVQVTIDTTGAVTYCEPVNKIGYGCDEEALRLIKQGSAFLPATMRGERIKSQTTIVVEFKR